MKSIDGFETSPILKGIGKLMVTVKILIEMGVTLVIFIILISILSEINNIKTKQQLQNERYKAEERLKDSK